MKKIIASILAVTIVLSIAGCSTAEKAPAAPTPMTTTTTTTKPETTTTTTTTTTTKPAETTKKCTEADHKSLQKIANLGNITMSCDVCHKKFTPDGSVIITTKPVETTGKCTEDQHSSLQQIADISEITIKCIVCGKEFTPSGSATTTTKPATTKKAENTLPCTDKYHKSAMEKGFTICPRCDEKLTTSTTVTTKPETSAPSTDKMTFKEYYNSDKLDTGTFVETTDDGTKTTYTLIYNSDYDIILPEKIVYEYSGGTNTVIEGIWNIDGRFAMGTITTTFPNGLIEKKSGQWGSGSRYGVEWYMHTADVTYTFPDGTVVRYSGNWDPEGLMTNGLMRVDCNDGSYAIYDGTWENGAPDNGTYKIFGTDQELLYRGKIKNGKPGLDWELIVGKYMQTIGQVFEGAEPGWSIILDKVGGVVADHGAIGTFD